MNEINLFINERQELYSTDLRRSVWGLQQTSTYFLSLNYNFFKDKCNILVKKIRKLIIEIK